MGPARIVTGPDAVQAEKRINLRLLEEAIWRRPGSDLLEDGS